VTASADPVTLPLLHHLVGFYPDRPSLSSGPPSPMISAANSSFSAVSQHDIDLRSVDERGSNDDSVGYYLGNNDDKSISTASPDLLHYVDSAIDSVNRKLSKKDMSPFFYTSTQEMRL
jgi:hypothetical protein